MSDQPDPRTRLVAETFHDEWASGPAHTFALRAAAHARRRRAARHVMVGGGVAATIVAAFFFTQRSPSTIPDRSQSPGPALAVSSPAFAPSSSISPAFEIISDDQLFAELRGRPVLILPQESAERRIVVLAR